MTKSTTRKRLWAGLLFLAGALVAYLGGRWLALEQREREYIRARAVVISLAESIDAMHAPSSPEPAPDPKPAKRFSEDIRPKMRAVVIPVEAVMLQRLSPGDRLDILLNAKMPFAHRKEEELSVEEWRARPPELASLWLWQDLRILALGEDWVLAEVTPEEGTLIALAAAGARDLPEGIAPFEVLIRSPHDDGYLERPLAERLKALNNLYQLLLRIWA
jgi:hypothetical protein